MVRPGRIELPTFAMSKKRATAAPRTRIGRRRRDAVITAHRSRPQSVPTTAKLVRAENFEIPTFPM